MLGKRLQLFALRHRGAPFEASDDKALRHFRYRVLDAQFRRRAEKGADPRYHLPGNAATGQLFALLAHRTV